MDYTNPTQVPLSLAVFLATDEYDHDPNTISATGLIKPLRQTILSRRVPKEMSTVNILGLVKSRMGTAIHSGIEKAWETNYQGAMRSLGYPDTVIDRIKINPKPEELEPDTIPVYMEQRLYRDFQGKRLSGKFDFVAEGVLEDFKSTSTFAWVHGSKDEDYQLQGSIYRWLGNDIITADHMNIQYLFTDWNKARASQDPNYPQRAVEPKKIPLLSLDDTEHYITTKLAQIDQYWKSPEEDIPHCNDKELWRKAPQFKYYKNPKKLARSTKNFDTQAEAYTRLHADGNVGIVIEKLGTVMACNYCAAFPICTQKDGLIADGSLIIE